MNCFCKLMTYESEVRVMAMVKLWLCSAGTSDIAVLQNTNRIFFCAEP